MSNELIPRNDRVLVKRLQPPETNPGSVIVIPDKYQKKLCEAEVLAVGPGKLLADGTRGSMQDLFPGAIIVIGQHAGTAVNVDGEDLLVVGEDEVLARVRVNPRRVSVEDILGYETAPTPENIVDLQANNKDSNGVYEHRELDAEPSNESLALAAGE